MYRPPSFYAILFFFFSALQASGQSWDGFFNVTYDEANGKLLLRLDRLNEDFLMVNSFGTGIGSNDLGMDRGRLMDTRIVRFEKHGDKLLLVQPNMDYRAVSSNPKEVSAVQEAFATSVLFGSKIEKKEGSSLYIDIAPLLLDDLNQVATKLKESKQGSYKLEKSRSALVLDQFHAFPDNIEFEALLTFAGEASGQYIRSVTPSPENVSFRQHVSFIRLPDRNYSPRAFHPGCGYFYQSYFDYATPIASPIEKKIIRRHRLEKKDPSLEVSDPVEPLIYYIDPGCPEPIKTALIEGGKWWAQAFAYAGFSNAFDVRELPEGAHPLDVRYNMIQWVHRSTRGWSYGASIADPRTGEIIKGHVSLGSLRVRQDFMLAQGLASPYEKDDANHRQLLAMSLDRLRQLSAHEIGHTLGLAHNFAASVSNRASVMDYPHPYITEKTDGSLDFSQAYDDQIGIWDKRAILYGYAQFTKEQQEETGLSAILQENLDMGLPFLTDEDARSAGSASPINHLWDNGKDAIDELNRIVALRQNAIRRFGPATIPTGTPYSELEKIFVPVYFMHRYQAEAASKLIGGLEYAYAVKGFGKPATVKAVDEARQKQATAALLGLLNQKTLGIPQQVQDWMYPPAYGFPRTRESFPTSAGPGFDMHKTVESATGQIIELLMHPERLARLANQGGLSAYLQHISEALVGNGEADMVRETAEIQYIQKLLTLQVAEQTGLEVRKALQYASDEHATLRWQRMNKQSGGKKGMQSPHAAYVSSLLKMKPAELKEWKAPPVPALPPGAPIGCSEE